MKTIPTKELKERLEKHKLAINTNGIEGEYAEFANYELHNIALINWNLSGINFFGSDFTNANLLNVDFTNANLENCTFNRANLSHAIFIGANMKGAKFITANMTGATVANANLSYADLTGIKFEKLLHSGANFTEAIMDNKLRKYIGVESELSSPTPSTNRHRIQHEPFSVHSMDIAPCFNAEQYALVFAEHIRHLRSESGQMVGIFGQWGRGKTYFFNKVWSNLESTNSLAENVKFQLIQFNPWKYQDTPAIWAYLYQTLYKNFYSGSFFKRLIFILRKEWWLFAIFLLGILVPLCYRLDVIIGSISFTITAVSLIKIIYDTMKDKTNSAMRLIRKYNKGIFNTTLGIQAEIEDELERLLVIEIPKHKVEKKKIILFIDDIDRCSQDKMIELIDSLRIILDNERIMKRLVIVCACDEDKLCAAIKLKYSALYPDSIACNKIAYEYIDKLFISGVKLPEIPNHKYDGFIEQLITSNKKSEVYSNPNNVSPTQNNKSDLESKTAIVNFLLWLKSLCIFRSEKVEMTDSSNTTNTSIQNTQNSIDDQDVVQLITNSVAEFKETLTPRRVRIFYYRYKLGKNIYSIHSNDLDVKLLLDGIKRRMEGEQIEDIDDANLRHVIRMVVAYTNEANSNLNLSN